MLTRYIKVNSLNLEPEKIEETAKILKEGGLVAFPTETVYGLGADAFNPQAVRNIFKAKGRPQDNPLIIHIWSNEQLDKLVKNIPQKAHVLMNNFWPGPLTVVLPKKEGVMSEATSGLDTVGVRMPDHPVALKLFQRSGVAVAAPSANISGKPSPTGGLHVLKDLAGKIDVVLDGGSAKVGVESTVVDCTGEIPVILRPGGVTKEEMEEVVGEVLLDPALHRKTFKPKSPGMKYSHYAPDGIMYLVVGKSIKSLAEKLADISMKRYQAGYKVALLAFEDTLALIGEKPYIKLSLGSRDNLSITAAKIYGLLRQCDRLKIDFIIAEGCPRKGMGLAVMNRLEKASGGKIIRLQD
ncbi:MAG: L-threonylcarbamoyladenylate synthase [Clostridia bacterium]|jgi:L-threonylcarbamoyladenylate synthase|nr:tRNA threonylcarbamoyl adenosine modification protein Sua5/YciO/YrdC/YwlC family [Clostridiales bacterium]MDK2985445.1 L-threonylcarbamoyladenylate synthase [Clostridia bacterium]